MSMMWRSSKTGEAPPSRDGIGIGPPLSGEASDTHAVTGPMRAVIGREAQELPPSMCCRDAFAPCAITDGSAMPLQMATDPLERKAPKKTDVSYCSLNITVDDTSELYRPSIQTRLLPVAPALH